MRNDHKNDTDLSGIEKLIERERQEGLEVFRKTDFSAKLEARIRSGVKPKYSWPFWLRRPVPVLGILLVLIITAVIVKSLIIPSSTQLEVIVVIENYLSQSPNIQRAFPVRQREGRTISPGSEAFYRFEWSIQKILFSVKREGIRDEDVPSLIFKFLDETGEPGRKKWVLYPEDESLKNLLDEIKTMKQEGKTTELFSQILKKLEEV